MDKKDLPIVEAEKILNEENGNQEFKENLKVKSFILEANQEKCLSSNSESSQEVMFSSCSTPIGTPFSHFCENLIKDEEFLNENEHVKTDLLNKIKCLQDNYETKLILINKERDTLLEQIKVLNSKLAEQEEKFNLTISNVKAQYKCNMDKIIKENESSKKHLESMVVNYAKSEKEVILTKKGKDDAEKKLREALKEKDSLFLRFTNLNYDKTSLKALLEKRDVELLNLQKDNEKLKEDIKDRDLKLKQAQYELKVEAHEDTCKKFSHILASAEPNSINIQDNKLGSELNTIKSENESEFRREEKTNECDQIEDKTDLELSHLRIQIKALKSNNDSLTLKIKALEEEKIDNQEAISKLNITLENLKIEYINCSNKLNELEENKLKIEKNLEDFENTKSELSRMKETNHDLMTEMESCKHKEGELLEFTERLTKKSVTLQSAHNILNQKCTALQDELNISSNIIKDLKFENKLLNEAVNAIKLEKEQEVNLLARKVAEKSKLIEEKKAKIEELENENKVVQKRYSNSVKELNREINQMKKQLDACENQLDNKSLKYNLTEEKTVASKESSSSTLLETVSSLQAVNTTCKFESENDLNGFVTTDNLPQLDKKVLINKIIKLQKVIAKKQEKIDFLDEHNQSLLQEMKKKTKLIQYYIIREEAGALSTNRMDENKEQLVKHGSSIMSSVYKSCPSDSAITLTLSLEINKKLQAVLEDTILKNITLKENLNTLGEEIAKLTQKKQKYLLNS